MTARLPHPRCHLPLPPAEEAGAPGIKRLPALLALLASVSAVLRDKLGARLDHVYPATPALTPDTEEFSA